MKIKISKNKLQNVIKEELKLARITGRKLTTQTLVSALKQRGYLVERASTKNIDSTELGGSLDAQIDRYLISYEKTSKAVKNEGYSFERLFNKLVEAPKDNEKEDSEDNSEEDNDDVKPPEKLTVEDISVEEFASNVVRLIENYDNLLEIKNTLITRSKNFLKKNYDTDVVTLFEDALRNNGFIEDMSDSEIDQTHKSPPGEFAGPEIG